MEGEENRTRNRVFSGRTGREEGLPRWFVRCLWFFAIATLVVWLLGMPFHHYGGRMGMRSTMGFSPVAVFLLMSLGIVALGIGLWWLLTTLFWRKYFPTQIPPDAPPVAPSSGWDFPGREASTAHHGENRKEELKRRLDELEAALLGGRISEATYRELKEKYEKELSSQESSS